MVFSHLRDRNPLKLSPFRLCHEFHHLSGYRMEKGEACGAQSQAACPDGHIRSGTIFPVTSQRHSCMSHLNPDLVMTACIQMNSKQPFFLSGNCIHSLTENLIGKSGLLRTRSVRIYCKTLGYGNLSGHRWKRIFTDSSWPCLSVKR